MESIFFIPSYLIVWEKIVYGFQGFHHSSSESEALSPCIYMEYLQACTPPVYMLIQ